MNAPSQDIKDILLAYGDSSGLDLDYGTTLFIAKEPTKPNNCVTIFDTGSFPPQLTLKGQGEDYYYPNIQIRVRNEKFTNGWNMAWNIMVALHGLNHQTVNGTLYTLIRCTSGPALLDWDENERVRFILNFNLQRR